MKKIVILLAVIFVFSSNASMAMKNAGAPEESFDPENEELTVNTVGLYLSCSEDDPDDCIYEAFVPLDNFDSGDEGGEFDRITVICDGEQDSVFRTTSDGVYVTVGHLRNGQSEFDCSSITVIRRKFEMEDPLDIPFRLQSE